MLKRVLRLSATAILRKPIKSVFSLSLDFLIIYTSRKDRTMSWHMQLIFSGMLCFAPLPAYLAVSNQQRNKQHMEKIPYPWQNRESRGWALLLCLESLTLFTNKWTGGMFYTHESTWLTFMFISGLFTLEIHWP